MTCGVVELINHVFKVIKNGKGANPRFYLRSNTDFKAEQFIRVYILPYIILNRGDIDPVGKLQKCLNIQKFAVISDKACKFHLPYN